MSPSPARFPSDKAVFAHDGDMSLDVHRGERIGAPVRRRGLRLLAKLAAVLALLGGAAAYEPNPATWLAWAERGRDWVMAQASRLQAAEPSRPATPVKVSADAREEPKAVVPPLAVAAPIQAPRATSEPVRETVLNATEPAPAAAPSAVPAASAPYVPEAEKVPPADAGPLRAKADAAGLHPDVPLVVLSRLSDFDFRNASAAIATALAETPEKGELVFPSASRPGIALFKVHFVPADAPPCRRYVVTIAKDGWRTTALPMEVCGPRPRPAR